MKSVFRMNQLRIAPIRPNTDWQRSDTTLMMNHSLSPPPSVKVIVSLEASGDFLMNVAKVLSATGMTLEQLFAFLAAAISAMNRDTLIPSMMVNARLPDSEASEIISVVGDMIDQLSLQTRVISEQVGDFKLLEVNSDDDSAVIEIAPSVLGEARNVTAGTLPERRRKMVAGNTIETSACNRIVGSQRSN